MANKYVIHIDEKKGKCLLANGPTTIHQGDIIFEERPLICSQFLWNAECKYDACQQCLSPLETAQENVTRLTKDTNITLPYVEQCCPTDKQKHCQCLDCGERYCSDECRREAFESHHQCLCPKRVQLDKLCQLWKSMHYPPETASIMLLMKILARVKQDPTGQFIHKLQQFSCNTIEESEMFIHKLLTDKFKEQIVILQRMVTEIVNNDETLKIFLSDDGFRSLLALIGKNGQGIGTSAFSKWAENCERLVANNPNELSQVNEMVEELFKKMDQVSGPFLNNEGSGLYELHSCINHSCEPNSEVCFPHNNFILSLKALQLIEPGEEITISYLDECWRDRSRHSRQKYLRENYLFTCKCPLCERQIQDPDVTSDEDDDEDNAEIHSDDDQMNCI